FVSCSRDLRHLRSFPTRRSSDLVALNAQNDARMAGFASVHQMMLESVACVPILAPSGRAVGALYVETRLRPGTHFERELPTLRADRKSTRLNSSHVKISYAVFCL